MELLVTAIRSVVEADIAMDMVSTLVIYTNMVMVRSVRDEGPLTDSIS